MKPSIEDVVEHIASVCDEVEFLHGVPVKLPSQTKAVLRGRIREALTTLTEQAQASERERTFRDIYKQIFLFSSERAINRKSTSEEQLMFHSLLENLDEYADEKGIDIDTPPDPLQVTEKYD